MEGKAFGELKTNMEVRVRRVRERKTAEKRVNSHFFSAPMVKRVLLQLGFVSSDENSQIEFIGACGLESN